MRIAVKYLIPLIAIIAAIALWAALVQVFAIPEYLLPAPQVVSEASADSSGSNDLTSEQQFRRPGNSLATVKCE